MKEHDKVYFETEFVTEMVSFIKIITSGLENVIGNNNFDLLTDLNNESFYDEMKDLEDSDPKRLDQVLSAHYVTRFLTDILQFGVAYFTRAISKAQGKEPEQRRLYDHRT